MPLAGPRVSLRAVLCMYVGLLGGLPGQVGATSWAPQTCREKLQAAFPCRAGPRAGFCLWAGLGAPRSLLVGQASGVLLDWMMRMAGRCVQAASRAGFSVAGGRKSCSLSSGGNADGARSCAEPQVGHWLCSFGGRGRCSASVAGWG